MNKHDRNQSVIYGKTWDYSWWFIKDRKIIKRKANIISILLQHKNKVVIVKNKRGWEFPWGHIEKWETYSESLHREVLEETWFELQKYQYIWYYIILNGLKLEYQLFFSWTTKWEQKEINSEILDVKIVLKEEIDRYIYDIENHKVLISLWIL